MSLVGASEDEERAWIPDGEVEAVCLQPHLGRTSTERLPLPGHWAGQDRWLGTEAGADNPAAAQRSLPGSGTLFADVATPVCPELTLPGCGRGLRKEGWRQPEERLSPDLPPGPVASGGCARTTCLGSSGQVVSLPGPAGGWHSLRRAGPGLENVLATLHCVSIQPSHPHFQNRLWEMYVLRQMSLLTPGVPPQPRQCPRKPAPLSPPVSGVLPSARQVSSMRLVLWRGWMLGGLVTSAVVCGQDPRVLCGEQLCPVPPWLGWQLRDCPATLSRSRPQGVFSCCGA